MIHSSSRIECFCTAVSEGNLILMYIHSFLSWFFGIVAAGGLGRCDVGMDGLDTTRNTPPMELQEGDAAHSWTLEIVSLRPPG